MNNFLKLSVFNLLLISLLFIFSASNSYSMGSWNSGLHISETIVDGSSRSIKFSWDPLTPAPEYGYVVYIRENNVWKFSKSTRDTFALFENLLETSDIYSFLTAEDGLSVEVSMALTVPRITTFIAAAPDSVNGNIVIGGYGDTNIASGNVTFKWRYWDDSLASFSSTWDLADSTVTTFIGNEINITQETSWPVESLVENEDIIHVAAIIDDDSGSRSSLISDSYTWQREVPQEYGIELAGYTVSVTDSVRIFADAWVKPLNEAFCLTYKVGELGEESTEICTAATDSLYAFWDRVDSLANLEGETIYIYMYDTADPANQVATTSFEIPVSDTSIPQNVYTVVMPDSYYEPLATPENLGVTIYPGELNALATPENLGVTIYPGVEYTPQNVYTVVIPETVP